MSKYPGLESNEINVFTITLTIKSKLDTISNDKRSKNVGINLLPLASSARIDGPTILFTMLSHDALPFGSNVKSEMSYDWLNKAPNVLNTK
uniref:Uncharacterized protein n=1 Tax=Romanomermis culicivorax TaxID=13658 RepID=A0A915JSM1_ROMCU